MLDTLVSKDHSLLDVVVSAGTSTDIGVNLSWDKSKYLSTSKMIV